MVVRTIDKFSKIAPVDVPFVPGNHDKETIYYLGEVLEAWYRNCPNVTIMNAPTLRKYYTWESTLIGYTHGNEEKHAHLPTIMALDVRKEWGNATHLEWRVGHLHSRKDTAYSVTTQTNEQATVMVRQLPSLSPPDAWHASKGYLNQSTATLFVHEKKHGVIAQFTHRPDMR